MPEDASCRDCALPGPRVTLYSTGCPRCAVLERKLRDGGIEYDERRSVDEMLALGLRQAPALLADGKLMDFSEAVRWIDAQKKEAT